VTWGRLLKRWSWQTSRDFEVTESETGRSADLARRVRTLWWQRIPVAVYVATVVHVALASGGSWANSARFHRSVAAGTRNASQKSPLVYRHERGQAPEFVAIGQTVIAFAEIDSMNIVPRREPLLRITHAGLYCTLGGFHIDPQGPVDRAVITHAHRDHLVNGCRSYLTAADGVGLVRHRVGAQPVVQGLPYGQALRMAGVTVSFHPAGHILGSGQIRIEHQGEVWVVSGDYHLHPHRSCVPFEPQRCHTFLTESTFGHPLFVWPAAEQVLQQLLNWWQRNREQQRASVVVAYALGKAQRLLAALDDVLDDVSSQRDWLPIVVSDDIAEHNRLYQQAGIALGAWQAAAEVPPDIDWTARLCVTSPSAFWSRPFPFQTSCTSARVSGWELLPDAAARRRTDDGFVFSDHADYPSLLSAITATEAEHVGVCHGYVTEFVADLQQRGWQAFAIDRAGGSIPPSIAPSAAIGDKVDASARE
jgi:putative mRNA 3-end processing factor